MLLAWACVCMNQTVIAGSYKEKLLLQHGSLCAEDDGHGQQDQMALNRKNDKSRTLEAKDLREIRW